MDRFIEAKSIESDYCIYYEIKRFEDNTGPFIYETDFFDIGFGINTWDEDDESLEEKPVCVVFYGLDKEYLGKYFGSSKEDVRAKAIETLIKLENLLATADGDVINIAGNLLSYLGFDKKY